MQLTALILAFLVFSRPAHAYIDPGTGSMVFQALVAGLLGAFFTIKMYWIAIRKKIAGFLSKDKKDDPGAK